MNYIMLDSKIPDNPTAQRVAEEARMLQQRVNRLESAVRFTNLQAQIESKAFENTISELPESLRRLRARGYKFQNSLDQTADELKDKWTTLCPLLREKLEQRAMILGTGLSPIRFAMAQVNQFASHPAKAEPLLAHARATIADLESRSKLAMREIEEPFTAYKGKVSRLAAGVEQLEWMLTEIGEAKFQLQANEGAVIGTKATWIRGDKDHPEGLLYLTDRRILFEQKQNVATKKFLFITTQSELVHKLLLEASVEKIEGIKASRKGFFRNEDHLEMTFGSGIAVSAAHFWLHGQDSSSWEELRENRSSGLESRLPICIAVTCSAAKRQ
jgi:hypothetical protein